MDRENNTNNPAGRTERTANGTGAVRDPAQIRRSGDTPARSGAVRGSSVTRPQVQQPERQKQTQPPVRSSRDISNQNAQNFRRAQMNGQVPSRQAGAQISRQQQSQMMKTKTTDSVSVLAADKQKQKGTLRSSGSPSSRNVRRDEKSVKAKKEKKAKKKDRTETDSEDRTAGSRNTIMSAVKAVVYIVVISVVSAFLAIGIIMAANDVFAFVKSDTPVQITIPENTKLDELADILHENGIIKFPWLFKLYAERKHDDQQYIPGEYTVNGMMNYSTLLSEFKEKIDYGTVRITIPEGFTTDEIIDMFVSEGIGTREGFIDEIQNGSYDYWFLDELENGGISEDRIYRLDGYLFPDTYDFYRSSSERTVIRKLLKRFSQIFTKQYREQCAAMGYTVDQIVTLASIIEKEAASPAEFFLVSSVFHNRLNNAWAFPRLESDATVVYAIQHDTGERTVDLTYESAYNTYTHEGLTPGPIANPSASAILAALSPQNSNYFYFVSYNGVTHFSETKAQHDQYVAEMRAEQQATTGDVPTE